MSWSLLFAVPPLSVQILRTDVPLVVGVSRRLECEVSNNQVTLSIIKMVNTRSEGPGPITRCHGGKMGRS